MSWRTRLDRALDDLSNAPGPIRVDGDRGSHADVDVTAADAIGVRAGKVRLHRAEPHDVAREAERLSRDVRSLPDRVTPHEVDPELGGAVLRSRPEDIRDNEFYEVRVEGERDVEVRRVQVDEAGERRPADLELTREQLGRLLGELDGTPSGRA